MLQANNSGVFFSGLGRFPTYASGRRHRLGGIELGSGSVEAYNHRLAHVCPRARPIKADQIASIGRRLLDGALDGRQSDFVSQRMAGVPRLVRMRDDRSWRLASGLEPRIAALLDYVSEPEDLIPDRLPVIGQLDDAILVDLLTRDIAGELGDYADFCSYRESIAQRCGVAPALVEVDYEQWFHQRLRERDAPRRALCGSYAGRGTMAGFRIG